MVKLDAAARGAVVEAAAVVEADQVARSVDSIDDVSVFELFCGIEHALIAVVLFERRDVFLLDDGLLVSVALKLGPQDDRLGLFAGAYVDGVFAEVEAGLSLGIEGGGG